MSSDIFEFWKRCPRGCFIHPDDAPILNRVPHHFQLNCLPAPFTGPLRSAKIVLLFLSPGLDRDGFDERQARDEAGKDWYFRQLGGDQPLPGIIDHEKHHSWWTRTVRQLQIDQEEAAKKIAVLDLTPYHSINFRDSSILGTLPSCRASIGWAQTVLFPQAIAGSRMVICLRAHKLWGLRKGAVEGNALFAPFANRRGDMLRGDMRDRIVKHAQNLCGKV